MWRDYGNQARIRKRVENMILFYAPDDWFAYAPYDPTRIMDDWNGEPSIPSPKAREIVAQYNGRICDGLAVSYQCGMWIDFETEADLITFKLCAL